MCQHRLHLKLSLTLSFILGCATTPQTTRVPSASTSPSPTRTPAATAAGPANSFPLPKEEVLRLVRYRELDEHVKKTPTQAENSIESLVSYLVKTAKNDFEKARAIFRWVADNIDYDWEGYSSTRYGDTRPDAVLKQRKSVCDGYAGLLETLAKKAGLEAVKISGYAKGYEYAAGTPVGATPNHAWNAVKVHGRWYLMDPTWGAGYISSEDKRFIRRFEEHYFLTPPELFVYDHLPTDPKWQLLQKPMTSGEYEELAYVRPAAFAAGLRAESHTKSVVETDSELVAYFRAPVGASLLPQLLRDESELPKTLTFSQNDSLRYEVFSVFPKPGEYTLRIFVKANPQQVRYHWAVDYRVRSRVAKTDPAGFPEIYSSFYDLSCYLWEPRRAILKAAAPQRFRVKVPDADNVAVVANSKWTHLKRQGQIFYGEVVFNSQGEVGLYAKLPGKPSFTGLAKFRVE